MNDQTIEQEIQAKGLTAPRVTPADIEANIASEHYFTADQGALMAYLADAPRSPEGCSDEEAEMFFLSYRNNRQFVEPLLLLTFCVLVLKNGFTVTGESACASPENFDAELGRKIARQNAISKVWPLMGYALKERLSQ